MVEAYLDAEGLITRPRSCSIIQRIISTIPNKHHTNNDLSMYTLFHLQLKKPKGGAPGMVSVRKQEGSIIGRPDQGKKWIDQFNTGLD